MAADEGQSKSTSGQSRRKQPVTIDLPAGSVAEPPSASGESSGPIPVSVVGGEAPRPRNEGPAQSQPAGGRSATADGDIGRTPTPRRGSGWAMLAGAVMGALVVLIGGYLLMFTDILPAPSSETAEDALAETERLQGEIDALRQAIADNAAPDMAPLADRVAALEAVTARLGDVEAAIAAIDVGLIAANDARADIVADLDGLRQEVVAAAAAAGNPEAAAEIGDTIAALSTRLAALEDAGPSEAVQAMQQALGELQAEVAALTAATEELAANAAERDRAADAARVLAVNNLRFAAERGDPFTTELAVLAELGVTPEALAPAQAIAETGAPSSAALAAAFDDIAYAILEATNQGNADAGFWERLFDNVGGVVTIRPTVPIEGDSPAAIVSRMQAAVDAGDFAIALEERSGLPEAGLAASVDWAADVEARLAVDAAIAALATAVQQQMGE